jgi:hypothetical protein
MEPTLTRNQLTQLVEEYQKLRDWAIVRDFCNQVYGEGKVHEITLETYGEYNDEGGTDYRVEAVTANDKNGEPIEFDLSLPFWKVVQPDIDNNSDEDDIGQILQDWYPDKSNTGEWLTWAELPCDVHDGAEETYYMIEPPKVSFILQPV